MTYYIDPFGCVKNQVDAENMMAALNKAGWLSSPDAAEADLVIVNSCGFIESAKQESINAVLGWRKLYPQKKILLAGCLAQRYAGELSQALPEADGFFGNRNLDSISAAAESLYGPAAAPAPAPGPEKSPGERPLLSLPGSAYVKINEGCDNHCAFCAIPLIRGPLQSRPIPAIIAECQSLLNRGIWELCLIGQDTGSYGQDLLGPGNTPEGKLAELLRSLSALEGDFWVRLLYIHPDNFPPAILTIMEEDPRFLPYFDIPFQHGSAAILQAMKRRGNAQDYQDLTAEIRRRLPDAVIRSTFMTGFPGETEEDFEALLDFQEKITPDWLGCFAFSREEGTPAYSIKPQVPKKTAARRKTILEEKQIPISQKRMERFIGRSMDVLVEEEFVQDGPDREPGEDRLYLGRLYCQAPEVDGAAVISSRRPLKAGVIVRGRVFARAGIDLEIRVK